MAETKQKKLKILYVITKASWGGAQRYVYDLATNIPKNKFEVVVVLGGTGELESKLKEASTRTISIQGLGRDIGILKDLSSFFALLKIFTHEKPDIIHLNSSKAGGLGALAGRFAGVKRIIFTAHGWAFNEERTPLSRGLIWFVSWTTVALSHTTIVVSDYDRKQADKMPLLKNKIIRIYNGIGRIKFATKKAAQENLLGEHASQFSKSLWIGTIAELHNNKGLPYALQAIKKLREKKLGKDLVYLVVGDGEERGRLDELVQKEELQDCVFFVGRREKASSLLRAFDIFLLPSIKEGLPYVVLEAGVAELPFVASAVGGIPEIVEDMKSGVLVKPKNAEEIALALQFLITNKEKRSKFGTNLKEKTANKFSVEKMIEETIGVYII